jgi:uridylate kinase
MNTISVLDLGGSLVVPHLSDTGGIDIAFLKKFFVLITKELTKGKRFVIVIGGGKATRVYQGAAKKVGTVLPEDLDWIGVHSTRLNAHLLRTIFYKYAHPKIIDHDPTEKEVKEFLQSGKSLFIASGWRPGWSTDYVAVRLAQKFQADKVVIATNISHVYSADPAKDKSAKPLQEISWKEYAKLIPTKWSPGLSLPVDPVATRLAQKEGITAFIVEGKKIANLQKALEGKPFQGTTIS